MTVPVQLCEKCYHSSPSCDVEVQGSFISLNTLVDVCDGTTSCDNTCELSPPVECTFQAPSVPDSYTLLVQNGLGDPLSAVLQVGGTCG